MAVRPAGTVELSPARLAEARELAAISRRYIEAGLAWRWRTTSLAQHIGAEDSCVVVARDDPRTAGFALMSYDFEAQDAHLLLLAVVPRYRRRGIGTRLLEWLEVMARRGGIGRIRLEVRESAAPAQHLYRALGFEPVSRLPGYYQGREDAIQLQKRLV